MKIIEKIELKSFRSFGNRKGDKTQVTKIEDLNIFSGSNDSGKSNILRGLNLFFNKRTNLEDFLIFENDFFKRRNPDEDDIKQEQITIKIYFWNQRNKGFNQKNPDATRLPERFWVSRKWLKNSEFSAFNENNGVETSFKAEKKTNWQDFYEDDNKLLKPNVRANLSKQLTDFLNSIQYHYVPAVKDKNYFSHLYGELQQTLLKEKNSNVNNTKQLFQGAIQDMTQLLMDEFKSVVNTSNINISAVFELPNLINLFKTLNVQTGNVNLKYRGDGIQAKLIPEILNFITTRELNLKPSSLVKGAKPKKYFIWGFEEPENSYEYKNAQLLADRFKSYFSQNAQIFLTTHSFNFLSISGENVSKFRVWKDDTTESTRINKLIIQNGQLNFEGNLDEGETERLNEELGVFQLNEDLENLFLEYKTKIENLKLKKNEVEKLILSSNKPSVFFEDKYLQVYQIAYLKLYEIENIPETKEEIEVLFNEKSKVRFYPRNGKEDLYKSLDLNSISEYNEKVVIGVFDFDSAYAKFNGLSTKSRWSDINGDEKTGLYKTRKENPNFHSLLLPVPTHRKSYASRKMGDKSVLEIELYFTDEVLESLNCLNEESIAGVTEKRKVFCGKKAEFWKKLASLDKSAFESFQMLFDKIDELGLIVSS